MSNRRIVKAEQVTKYDGCAACTATLGACPDPEMDDGWVQVDHITRISIGRESADGKLSHASSVSLCDECLTELSEVIKRALAKNALKKLPKRFQDDADTD